jgi:hypothetical protein
MQEDLEPPIPHMETSFKKENKITVIFSKKNCKKKKHKTELK